MNESLRQHYLHSMGIVQWIERRPHELCLAANKATKSDCAATTMMVIADVPEMARPLFNQMLASIGVLPHDVHVEPESADSSTKRLAMLERLTLLKPRCVLVMGQQAARCLLNTGQSLDDLRNACQTIQGIPVIVSYHPSQLMTEYTLKSNAYVDMLKVSMALHQGDL